MEENRDKMTARINGPSTNAREFRYSEPEIEWSCCDGIICGHAWRTGCNADDLAVYRLSGVRHPAMTGTHCIVNTDGVLLAYNGEPVVRRCAIYGGI